MIDYEQLVASCEKAIASNEMIGVAVAVVEGETVTFSQGFGSTRFEQGTPITAETRFHYGSVAKLFCSILVMRLVEEGHLQLDKPVIEYLPGFVFRDLSYGNRVTLRHLLSHTSGLPMGGRYYGLETDDALAQAIWDEIPHYRFSAEPGTVYNYSNTAMCMAGYIAEAVMEQGYDDLLSRYLFDPLGLKCNWDFREIILHPLALPHKRKEDGGLEVLDRVTFNRAGHPSSFYMGSVTELAEVAAMLLSSGKLLSDQSLTQMMTMNGSAHVESATHFIERQVTGYGLGMMLGDYRGVEMWGHGGMTPGYFASIRVFPNSKRAAILLTTYTEQDALIDLIQGVHDLVLEMPPSPGNYLPLPEVIPYPANIEIDKLCGRFMNPEQYDLVFVSVEDGRLMLDAFGRKEALSYTASGEFVAPVENENRVMSVRFLIDQDGIAQHITLWGTPYNRNNEVAPEAIDVTMMQRYAGRYVDKFNTDPDDILTATFEDGELFLWEGEPDGKALRPLGVRRFLSGMGVVEFEVSAENEVIAVQIAHAARYFPISETNHS